MSNQIAKYIINRISTTIHYIENLKEKYRNCKLDQLNNTIINTYCYTSCTRQVIWNNKEYINLIGNSNLNEDYKLFRVDFIHNLKEYILLTKDINKIHPLYILCLIMSTSFKETITNESNGIEFVEINNVDVTQEFKKIIYSVKTNEFNVNDIIKLFPDLEESSNKLNIIMSNLDELTFKDSDEVNI